MDLSNRKIIDYYIVEKSSKCYNGNYQGSSQGMETECFSKLSSNWIGNENIISICQDNDNDHSNIYRESKWNVRYIETLMVRIDICNSIKIELWKNVPRHLAGDHKLCDHDLLINHNFYRKLNIMHMIL